MAMPSTSIIPIEIHDTIIDILAENAQNLSSVKACSLVCWSFLPLCRRHIFGSIVLNAPKVDPPSPTTRQLDRLLSTTPEISDYIRRLDYNIAVGDFTSPSIQGCLKQISRLQFLFVWHKQRGPRLDWSNNHLRPALLHLLHLPTLTHFKMFAISNFILSDLVPCLNLKKLEIGNDTLVLDDITTLEGRSIKLDKFASGIRNVAAIMKICKAQYLNGEPLVDFSSLASISVRFQRPEDIVASQELFRRCKQLTDVLIMFRDPRVQSICPSIVNMLRPSMQTMKRVSLHIIVDGPNDDPLATISSEFEDVRGKNIIEEITIDVTVEAGRNYRPGDDWSQLDQVLTRSGWSTLKEVSLLITISSWGTIDPGLEVSLKELPETRFPRLSTRKNVEFVFDVSTFVD